MAGAPRKADSLDRNVLDALSPRAVVLNVVFERYSVSNWIEITRGRRQKRVGA